MIDRQQIEHEIQLADWFYPYLEATDRYLVAYGGRDSGKSYQFSLLVVYRCITRPGYRVLIVRDYRTGSEDSALDEVRRRCNELEIPNVNAPPKSRHIEFGNGSRVTAVGIERNPGNIRSIPGVDFVWCEESNALSEISIEVLLPTIRKEGSQLGFTFNPDKASDPVYQMFVEHPVANALITKVNYDRNYWLSDTSKATIEEYRNKPGFSHVFLGQLAEAGSIFDNSQINETDNPAYWNDGRACRAWDLAWTQDSGDFTVGQLQRRKDNDYLIADVVAGQWNPRNSREQIIACARRDNCVQIVEETVGAKAWLDDLRREMTAQGLSIILVKPAGKTKVERAVGYAGAWNAGLYYIPKGAKWWPKVRDEHASFPAKDAHDDTIDAGAYAFNYLSRPEPDFRF